MRDHRLISVVVPVYNVRRYLPQCLDSLLGDAAGQPVPIEVVAVDDASDDGSGALLDERAAADPRLTVIRVGTNSGPGNARNTGLAAAGGDYIWFVDGDDMLPPGALEAVAGRLRADRPDVLLIGYEELHAGGRTRPGPGTAVLRAAPGGSFTLAEAPQMITLSMTAWSKLFRREFLVKLGEPFRPGIHEDIPVTCAALLSGRLSALALACYRYRRSRTGSFMATTSTGHMAVFGAYEQALALLRERVAAGDPVATPAVQSAMFERAVWHYTSVLQTTGPGIGPVGRPGLVPRSQRRRFFEQMHAEFLRWRPPGYQLPPGPRGTKFRLVERDAYWTYEMLEPLNKLRIALRGPSAG